MSSVPVRHSNATLAAFAAPCLPMAALGLPLVVHLPHFFASTVGISLGTVTAIFLAVKLLDIAVDPILGSWMDKTRTKLGRFKPWMLLSIVILALATYMVFMPPGLKAGPVYLAGWLLLIYIGFSVAVLGQTAWASVLSPDYDQRSRIYGFWTTGNVVGILLVLLLPVIVTARGGNEAQGVAAMGWFIIILLPITIGLAVWRVPEPVPDKASHGKFSDYIDFLKLASVRRLMWTDLLFCCSAWRRASPAPWRSTISVPPRG
jgi:Na+/melibiose symporter-like transporter